MREKSARIRAIVGLTACLILVLLPAEAWAIPAFARKYKTSCQTCHVAFPQATPFGEAFRLNGYRFPSGGDVDAAKVEEIELGAEGYKKVWPEAVWPTTLTWVPPISIFMAGEATYTPNTRVLDRPGTSFNDLNGHSEIMAGGTLGESFSYFVEFEFATSPENGDDVLTEGAGAEIAVERTFVIYRPLEKPLLNFKIGLFEPGISNVAAARRLTRSTYLLTKEGRPGQNNFSTDDANRGIEAFGVTGSGRLLYNLGVIEGNRDAPTALSEKDVYLRLAYKLGGLRLDGEVEDTKALMSNPRPWAEQSVTFSVAGLTGTANVDDGADGIRDPFNMLVADAKVIFDDASITVGGNIRSDKSAEVVAAGTADRVNSSNIFVEAQYVVFPWFIPIARYENFNETFHNARQRIDVTLNFLMRANVKATLFYVYDAAIGDEGDDAKVGGRNNNIFGAGLALAF